MVVNLLILKKMYIYCDRNTVTVNRIIINLVANYGLSQQFISFKDCNNKIIKKHYICRFKQRMINYVTPGLLNTKVTFNKIRSKLIILDII